MSHGYSVRLVEAIKGADAKLIGVRLGRMCLRHDVSVVKVAEALGVSRQTIYHWFSGIREPNPSKHDKIKAFIDSLG